MKIIKAFVVFLFFLSTATLIFGMVDTKNISEKGTFIIQSNDERLFVTKEVLLRQVNKNYPEIVIDLSLSECGTIVMTIPEYMVVDSYRKVEQAASLLRISDYRIYEAGLISESMEEKLRVAFWGDFFVILFYLICRVLIRSRRELRRFQLQRKQRYFNEIMQKEWKLSMKKFLLIAGCVIGIVVIWKKMTFFPLLPMTSNDFWQRLWDGLSGNRLVPDVLTRCIPSEIRHLWIWNRISNLAIILHYLCLMSGCLYICYDWRRRRNGFYENSTH